MAKKKRAIVYRSMQRIQCSPLRDLAQTFYQRYRVLGDRFGTWRATRFLPTPDDELNKILDREGRGIPMGRIIETFGPPQTGKSSLAYAAIAAVQRLMV